MVYMILKPIKVIISTILLILIGYYFGLRGIRFYAVISESMLPTLEIGDRLIGEKPDRLKHADIIVLDDPLETGGFIIKRLIGMEGDTIEIKNDGFLYRNGKKINESYIKEIPSYTIDEIKINKDEVFVLGDNRNNSYDSSIVGPLPLSTVKAKILIRYWPIKRFKIF